MRQFEHYNEWIEMKDWKNPEYFLDDRNFPIMIIEKDDTYLKETLLSKNGLMFMNSKLDQHGYGNGYVGIPMWHPWVGMGYDKLNEILDIENGLTYSHLDPDRDYYWIGFDTNHWGMTQENWGKDRMMEQCREIIRQAKECREYQRGKKKKITYFI